MTGWTVVASPRIVLKLPFYASPSPTIPHDTIRYDTTPKTTFMGPYIFFRVEDEDSCARYIDEEGLFAEDTETCVDFTS